MNNESEQIGDVLVGEQRYQVLEDDLTTIVIDECNVQIDKLDLMLMIDTTGSMGDELKYLQKELEDVIGVIAEQNKVLSINISVNFYRDETDDYIIKSFEFTDDIQKALAQLANQNADGGGDYPEAVHIALKDAVNNHQWREDSVKLFFFVLDAPPHSEQDIKGINDELQQVVTKMAENGIRIIPIASSGVDTETEFLLRSWALMTGGTYAFLTDHSGVGNSHLEPTVGEYEVEKLNELMIRIINEYCIR